MRILKRKRPAPQKSQVEKLSEVQAKFEVNQRLLAAQDKQLAAIKDAEATLTGDDLISFWENLWAGGGLLFNGTYWTFRLPELYIKAKRLDDAEQFIHTYPSAEYQDRADKMLADIQRRRNRKSK
jgi:hypothetical protein